MTFDFHPAAQDEFMAAVDWYEAKAPGLGLDFAAEVREAISRAVMLPVAWPDLGDGVRRVLVHRFPYGVLYAATAESVSILAVMHLRREPGYWRDRR